MSEPTQICRGFTDEQWVGLRSRLVRPDETITDDDAAWRCAVEVFERRIRERFLSCIEALEKADSRLDIPTRVGAPPDCSKLPPHGRGQVVVPGFAIMALCCVLIETLQLFREGLPEVSPIEVLYKKFLKLDAFRGEFDDKIIESFVYKVRNGLMHEAGTRRWVIWREEPAGRILERRGLGYVLYRSEFYKALKTEFDNYVERLRDPENQDLRKCFVKKMDDIVKKI
jgi:hypothetical protein